MKIRIGLQESLILAYYNSYKRGRDDPPSIQQIKKVLVSAQVSIGHILLGASIFIFIGESVCSSDLSNGLDEFGDLDGGPKFQMTLSLNQAHTLR